VAAFPLSEFCLTALVALVLLVVAGGVALALLARVLSAPHREVRVRVAVLPWPRIDIETGHAPPARTTSPPACRH
jgi:hypothetical protein